MFCRHFISEPHPRRYDFCHAQNQTVCHQTTCHQTKEAGGFYLGPHSWFRDVHLRGPIFSLAACMRSIY